MARVDINGSVVEFPDDLTPDELRAAVASSAAQLSTSPASSNRKTLRGFADNAVKDYSAQAMGQAELASYAFPPLAAMKAAAGTNIYEPGRLKMIGQSLVEGVKQAPKNIANSLLHPIESGYERPLSTALDIGTIATTVGAGAGRILKPIVTAKQLESLSGAVPGTLEAVYEKPSLLFGSGKKSASAKYQTLKEGAGEFREDLMFKKTKQGPVPRKNEEFVNAAANAKDLTPIEALEARKALDKLKKIYPPETFNKLRDKFDSKAKESFSSADKAYKDAIMSESARSILPQNKYGGTSAFKIGVQAAISKLADSDAGIVGNALAAGMSPAAQSTVAAGSGALAKSAVAIPPLVIAQIAKSLTTEKAKEFLKLAKKDRTKARQLAKEAGYSWEGMQ